MRLTAYTDYALRVLIYLGIQDDARTTIGEIATRFGLSRPHLMKIVNQLANLGYLNTVRGKGGGLTLARPARAIRIGAVVRATESDLRLVECFDPTANACRIAPGCVLAGICAAALQAFLAELDRYTLADLIEPRTRLRQLLLMSRPVGPELGFAP